MDELVKWGRGLLKTGGALFSLKGGDLTEEIKRTRRLNYIVSVEEIPLSLAGFDNFVTEDKKLVKAVFGP